MQARERWTAARAVRTGRSWARALLAPWFIGAVGRGPIIDFFSRYGLGLGVLIFAFISAYRLTDYAMGTMTNHVLHRPRASR